MIYTPEGATEGVEFFPRNPELVVVDTRIVAEAPVRYLVSGMGDAIATCHEARTFIQNPAARNVLPARPLAYEPFPVTSEIMIAAAIRADEIGREAVRRVGDEAYRRLHAA